MSVILITGTTGFVGGNLVHSLRGGNRIIEVNRADVRRSTDSFAWNFRDALPAGLPTKADIVIHSAADTSESPHDGCTTNVAATSALLEYAREAGAGTFVYLSTGSVYGASAIPHQERQPIFPRGVYACTKAAGEFVVQSYQHYLRTLILRLYFPFGPGQRKERLIPRLIHRVSHGEPIPLTGSGGPVVSPLYVDDLTYWVRLLLDGDATGTFNLAGNEHVSIRQLAEKIGRFVNAEPRFDVREGDPAHAAGDTTEVERATGYSPRWNLERSLATLANRRMAA
jgi:nucleoside-diphosphate-sugar epimerase